METSKTINGLLNTTLKGIRLVSGEWVSEEAVKLISQGLLISITKKSIADEFILYVKETYSIDLKY